jgi:hypothetical protein
MRRPLLLCLILAAACGGTDDRAASEDPAAIVPTEDPGALPEAMQGVSLQPAEGQSLDAQVVIVPVGVQSQVSVHVRRGPQDASLVALIRSGSCAEPGPEVADLQPVRTDASGDGSSQIVIDLEAHHLRSAAHVVELRTDVAPAGQAVACGSLAGSPE